MKHIEDVKRGNSLDNVGFMLHISKIDSNN